jgi:hypothetical protein
LAGSSWINIAISYIDLLVPPVPLLGSLSMAIAGSQVDQFTLYFILYLLVVALFL